MIAEVAETDLLIIGQGLAGSALAWEAVRRGLSIHVIDDAGSDAASGIAAGLITPLTGRRIAVLPDFPKLLKSAEEHYRTVSQTDERPLLETGSAVFRVRPEEQDRAARRSRIHDETESGVRLRTGLAADGSISHFDVRPTARLDVQRYLQLTRNMLEVRKALTRHRVTPETDISATEDGVTVRLNTEQFNGRALILCTGARQRGSRWFPDVPDRPAKGEILTLTGVTSSHRHLYDTGTWLVRIDETTWAAGSTYDRERLDDAPTAAGAEQITSGVKRLTGQQTAPTIVSHRAAVRPATRDRNPVSGQHQEDRAVWVLNGLGSRGALLAPTVAKQLARQLESWLARQKQRHTENDTDY